MSDFPPSSSVALPTHISPLSIFSLGLDARGFGAVGVPAAVTWSANLAIYVPFSIPWSYPVNRVWWVNGSTITSTNVDFGIYSAMGTRIYSTGSTAMSGASSVQYVTPSTPFTLAPESYYFAWTCNNTTSRGFASATGGAAAGRMLGLSQQASALPLPATATFTTLVTLTSAPYCGITRTTSGF